MVFAQKQYDKALPNFIRELNYHRQSNDINPVMETSREIAKKHTWRLDMMIQLLNMEQKHTP
jgi:hypothetical protein